MQAPVQTFHRRVDRSPQLQIVPLKPFGAEIIGFGFGFDFSSEVTPDNLQEIRTALLTHKMLLIRNHHLSATEQILLTRFFGSELQSAGPSLRYLPDYPEIFRITNRPGSGNANTGQYWHADGHYLADPSSVTVMHIVQATADGPTLVTDSMAAYDRLPNTMKNYLFEHGFFATETGVAHPIVRAHPHTGQLGLYVNLRAVPIDWKLNRHPEVSTFIDQHLNQEGTYYAHHWQDGDTLIVDNFATAHRGMPSDPANMRTMHRTTLTGQSVWWRSRSRQ